jgi:hypothetical protein
MSDSAEAKPRPLKLDSHVLAYLGDYITVYEETIKRIARKAAQDSAASNIQNSQGQIPAAPKCTASAPSHS